MYRSLHLSNSAMPPNLSSIVGCIPQRNVSKQERFMLDFPMNLEQYCIY